jgi:hypothetical protein
VSKYVIGLGSLGGRNYYEVRKKRLLGSEYIALFNTEKEAVEFIEERIRLEKKYS